MKERVKVKKKMNLQLIAQRRRVRKEKQRLVLSDKKRLGACVTVCDVEGQVVLEDIAVRL